MGDFTLWYGGLGTLQQVFWACAAVASLVFVVQMVLTLMGMDTTSADFDAPDMGAMDGDTMDAGGSVSLFSIRNLVNFLLGFGWAGVCFDSVVPNRFLLVLLAILVGLAFVWMFFALFKQLKRFEANGAFNIRNCLGRTANVYLRIPAHGKGKIQISINGASQEIDAISDGDPIPTGALVKVTEIIDGQTLRVTPL